MMVMNFLEWFETCPAWQALCLSLAGIAVIMAVEKLLCRLLLPGQASPAPRPVGRSASAPQFAPAGPEFDDTVPAT
ncbi:MAG: hypothetical protein V1806_00090 [Pseudomonadota bacterium]